MTNVARRLSAVISFAGAAIALLSSAPARAVVTQPNGLRVPQPSSANEVQAAANTNPLFPVASLDALFKARGEIIDWQADAQKKPDTFSPACGFSADLVLRGGGCRIDFGWYNVVPGQTPTDAEIYPLITAAQIAALPFEAFQPGAGERIPGLQFEANTILADPNYRGGLIGFATRGGQGTFCTQTHYSQQTLNPLCTNCTMSTDGDNHWIASVIYKSTVDVNGYYIAFEDLPMSATSFEGDGQYKNDGDMNDFVFFVTGVNCPGGGRACDTGKLGFCKQGVSQCESGGLLSCKQYFEPRAEKCDGIDNDCNGTIDDGDPTQLCDLPKQTCFRGQCVDPCGDVEFPCAVGLVCKSGLCVDPACLAVDCPANQLCSARDTPSGKTGVCVGGCDGVSCPAGQVCHIDRCVDLCKAVTCPADRICQQGACVPRCQCQACDAGKACQTATGKCVPDGCAATTCPADQVCQAGGSCVDGCQGVVCPADQMCQQGACVDRPRGSGTGGRGGAVGGTGGSGAVSPGTGGSTGQDAGAAGGAQVANKPANCGCDVQPGAPPLGAVTLTLALWALGAARRRGRTRSGIAKKPPRFSTGAAGGGYRGR